MAEENPDLGKVLLFDEAVIILVERAAAGEFDTLGGLLPEADEVVVEELTAIIGNGLPALGRQASQDVAEGTLP